MLRSSSLELLHFLKKGVVQPGKGLLSLDNSRLFPIPITGLQAALWRQCSSLAPVVWRRIVVCSPWSCP